MGRGFGAKDAFQMEAPSISASTIRTWRTIAITIVLLFLIMDRRPQAAVVYQLEHVRDAIMPPATSRTTDSTKASGHNQACPEHRPITRLISIDPLMIYIEDLLTKEEAAHLLELAEPHPKPWTLVRKNGKKRDGDYRKSVSAEIHLDPVLACIRQRVAEYQGFATVENVEDFHVIKYGIDSPMQHRLDWNEDSMNPRLTTFFVYVQCDDGIGGSCEGGETSFPHWSGQLSSEWCEKGILDCETTRPGLTFRTVVGNAVFWSNYYANRTAIRDTWHAEMPVKKGHKAGLSIWTRR